MSTWSTGSGAGKVRELDRASLAFGRGDSICIVGPSGFGKTTLLQTLAGFIAQTRGSVRMEGVPVVSRVRIAETALRGRAAYHCVTAL